MSSTLRVRKVTREGGENIHAWPHGMPEYMSPLFEGEKENTFHVAQGNYVIFVEATGCCQQATEEQLIADCTPINGTRMGENGTYRFKGHRRNMRLDITPLLDAMPEED